MKISLHMELASQLSQAHSVLKRAAKHLVHSLTTAAALMKMSRFPQKWTQLTTWSRQQNRQKLLKYLPPMSSPMRLLIYQQPWICVR